MILLSFAALAFQQTELFKINGEPTSTEEFLYFYKKNNRDSISGNLEKKVDQYLNLFIDFKLKIMEARAEGYDTTASFKKELKTYLGQLSESYMKSETSSDKLIKEAYDRMKEDVDASHILIRIPGNPTPSDTLTAYNKALSIYERAKSGENFDELAAGFSEEPYAKISKGRLGFFTVFQMVYPFESAAYNLSVGQISNPVRSQFGYHIIKLNDRRPAMGTVYAAHIMVRLTGTMTHQDSIAAKEKIFWVYDSLRHGGNWDALCKLYSDDQNSRNAGGKIRPFGVRGLNLPDFENRAYLLDTGVISKPFLSRYGWHILKINKKEGIGSFEQMKPLIQRKMANDSRSRLPNLQWIERMKKKYHYMEFPELNTAITGFYDTTKTVNLSDSLFSLRGNIYTDKDLKDYIANRTVTSHTSLMNYYNQFVEDKLKELEEKSLDENNFEYRMLKKEYYQGILLFAIMEDKIWKTAESDSTGLRRYYEDHKSQYLTKGKRCTLIRAPNDSLTSIVFDNLLNGFDELADPNDSASVKKWAESQSSNKSVLNLTFTQAKYREDDPFLSNLQVGINKVVVDNNQAVLILPDNVEEWIQEFKNIKGLVISDYQKELENKWVEELRKNYTIRISRKGLKNVLNVLEKANS